MIWKLKIEMKNTVKISRTFDSWPIPVWSRRNFSKIKIESFDLSFELLYGKSTLIKIQDSRSSRNSHQICMNTQWIPKQIPFKDDKCVKLSWI